MGGRVGVVMMPRYYVAWMSKAWRSVPECCGEEMQVR